MSHVTKVACAIKDLDALRASLERFGAELLYGKREFQYYAGNREKCMHAIKVPGTQYEIGLRLKDAADPETFELACDFYDATLAKVFGSELSELKMEYGAVIAEKSLQRSGWRTQRAVNEQGLQYVDAYA